MAEPIARAVEALERYEVTYETTPTDTVVETDSLDELFAAVRGAHQAIADEHRVVTTLEIDYQPGRPRGMDQRVHEVERELGRPPRSERAAGGRGGRASSQYEGGREPGRYEGGRRGQPYDERQVPVGTGAGDRARSASDSGRRYGSRWQR